MSQNDYQGGSYFELFSTQGRNPISNWKLQSATSIKKLFDRDVKSYVYSIEGGSQTRLATPKDEALQPLFLVQRFLCFQLFVPPGQPFYLELTASDLTGTKRRLFLSSSSRGASSNPLHARIPLTVLRRGVWNNFCLDMASIVESNFRNQTFRAVEGMVLGAHCRLRRIFTMRCSPPDSTDDNMAYECQPSYDGVLNEIPRSLQLPSGVRSVTQVIDMPKVWQCELNSSARSDRSIGDREGVGLASTIGSKTSLTDINGPQATGAGSGNISGGSVVNSSGAMPSSREGGGKSHIAFGKGYSEGSINGGGGNINNDNRSVKSTRSGAKRVLVSQCGRQSSLKENSGGSRENSVNDVRSNSVAPLNTITPMLPNSKEDTTRSRHILHRSNGGTETSVDPEAPYIPGDNSGISVAECEVVEQTSLNQLNGSRNSSVEDMHTLRYGLVRQRSRQGSMSELTKDKVITHDDYAGCEDSVEVSNDNGSSNLLQSCGGNVGTEDRTRCNISSEDELATTTVIQKRSPTKEKCKYSIPPNRSKEKYNGSVRLYRLDDKVAAAAAAAAAAGASASITGIVTENSRYDDDLVLPTAAAAVGVVAGDAITSASMYTYFSQPQAPPARNPPHSTECSIEVEESGTVDVAAGRHRTNTGANTIKLSTKLERIALHISSKENTNAQKDNEEDLAAVDVLNVNNNEITILQKPPKEPRNMVVASPRFKRSIAPSSKEGLPQATIGLKEKNMPNSINNPTKRRPVKEKKVKEKENGGGNSQHVLESIATTRKRSNSLSDQLSSPVTAVAAGNDFNANGPLPHLAPLASNSPIRSATSLETTMGGAVESKFHKGGLAGLVPDGLPLTMDSGEQEYLRAYAEKYFDSTNQLRDHVSSAGDASYSGYIVRHQVDSTSFCSEDEDADSVTDSLVGVPSFNVPHVIGEEPMSILTSSLDRADDEPLHMLGDSLEDDLWPSEHPACISSRNGAFSPPIVTPTRCCGGRGNSFSPPIMQSTNGKMSRLQPIQSPLRGSIVATSSGGTTANNNNKKEGGVEVSGDSVNDPDEELDLLYDPMLNCYYDPRSNKYYELA